MAVEVTKVVLQEAGTRSVMVSLFVVGHKNTCFFVLFPDSLGISNAFCFYYINDPYFLIFFFRVFYPVKYFSSNLVFRLVSDFCFGLLDDINNIERYTLGGIESIWALATPH